MSQGFIISFRRNICLIEEHGGEHVILQSPNRKLTFKQVTSGLKTALKTLTANGATTAQLSHLVQQSDGVYGRLKFYYHLQKFSQFGWLCHSVLADGFVIASALPTASEYQFPTKEADTQLKYCLSRFAYCHQVERLLLLESPLSLTQVILPDWRGAALIAQIASPHNYSELATQIPGITEDTAKQFVSLLLSAHLLSEVHDDGIVQEEENVTLTQWDFHDLLFHTRSRKGRHNNPYGATYRFLGKIEPLPAVKIKMSEDFIDLYKPDIETLKTTDTPFTQVLESRKSIREYREIPITSQQLGEFLYRSARVISIRQTSCGELSNRPYPAGGAIYELELYVVANICESILFGLYHYEPKAHQLYRLCGRTNAVEELLKNASQSTGQKYIPQVLIVIAARFQRLAWKYESMAYAMMLKHVGVLYQNMYLVATAMGLAPCGLGGGNSDLFVKAAGTDYYAETSVGEFTLGGIAAGHMSKSVR